MSISETVRAGMVATNELFCSTVIREGKFEALDDVYTAGARILPPGAPLIEGLEGIKSFWSAAVAGLGVVSATLATVDAEAAGDDVVEIGAATLTLQGGAEVAVKYVVHWKLEGGRWKWHTDIWNTNS